MKTNLLLSILLLATACADTIRDLSITVPPKGTAPTASSEYAAIPVIIAGDFNSMSHLDYTAEAQQQYGFVIQWPTSVVMKTADFIDSYRELHPQVNRSLDRTWSPRFPKQEQDRIDYIYYKGGQLKALSSQIKETHPIKFPSDHTALITDFSVK